MCSPGQNCSGLFDPPTSNQHNAKHSEYFTYRNITQTMCSPRHNCYVVFDPPTSNQHNAKHSEIFHISQHHPNCVQPWTRLLRVIWPTNIKPTQWNISHIATPPELHAALDTIALGYLTHQHQTNTTPNTVKYFTYRNSTQTMCSPGYNCSGLFDPPTSNQHNAKHSEIFHISQHHPNRVQPWIQLLCGSWPTNIKPTQRQTQWNISHIATPPKPCADQDTIALW